MGQLLLEPDVSFIKVLNERGGDTLKKCFQCATCSVACPISPDNKPFPRKEMIAASWGLKERLVSDLDIWLCHNCGDCSVMCPRGARPGDVLGAIRNYAIEEYSPIPWLAKAVNDPKKLPVLLLIPVILFLVMGKLIAPMLWAIIGPIFGWIFRFDPSTSTFLNFSPELFHGEIAHGQFFSTWLVDMIFIPTAIFAVVCFALGLKRFVVDMHNSAVREGKVKETEFSWVGLAKALPTVLVTILRHDKFNECSENKSRGTSHMMVLFGFIGLFVVTNICLVYLYGSALIVGYEHAWHGPYGQLNPAKWLANFAGISLLVGSLAMIKNRLGRNEQHVKSSYPDWSLLGLVLGLAVTGLGAEVTRLAGAEFVTYLTYFLHLVFVWCLFAYVPFSKLAHLVYRTTALAYAEYAGRDSK
ncbi:MAG: quinone-interacting membrane-bound oxidoreductase complex subunit QmoC [Desulfatibacillum sp.]|nr:quinone-interacting membrane-bound oxidoreductase complex subunit QmoC [Desulfatibacillum sp.]